MKKTGLSIFFLITLHINVYATSLSDHDVNTIMDKFSVIDALKESAPYEANKMLRDVQNEHGGKDSFHPIFGERYDQLKAEIRNSLNRTPVNPASAKTTTYFHKIIVSESNPGKYSELANQTIDNSFTELHVDLNKTSKEALEEALNTKKNQLLQDILPPNKIETARLKVNHIDIRGGENGSFSSRLNKRALDMSPEALGLHKPGTISNSMLSITIE
jgi:hypothetical protein